MYSLWWPDLCLLLCDACAVQRELELIAEALRIPGNKSLGPVAKVCGPHAGVKAGNIS